MSEGLINVLDIYFTVLTVIWDKTCKDWFKIVSLIIECSPSAFFVGFYTKMSLKNRRLIGIRSTNYAHTKRWNGNLFISS